MSETPTAPTAHAVPFFENRAFPRRPAVGSATFVPIASPLSPSVRVTLVDISQGGVRFTATKELRVGDVIVVELQWSVSNSQRAGRAAEVRWVGPDAKPGHFRVGCAWRDRLSYADLLRFG